MVLIIINIHIFDSSLSISVKNEVKNLIIYGATNDRHVSSIIYYFYHIYPTYSLLKSLHLVVLTHEIVLFFFHIFCVILIKGKLAKYVINTFPVD